ncbi:C-reactive protein-like isoform X1 [Heptranchias perlo]|uniref:C-reactive protein-like isoform X1 n=3 Tax=Heptranchias perlo TaxID=212740 RepID=UPI003559B3EF
MEMAGRRMKTFIAVVLWACIYLPLSASQGLEKKSLIFPTKTSTSYVVLEPKEMPSLPAFTLCMKVASESTFGYSLFSYATTHHDNELLVWYERNGDFSLYLSSTEINFILSEMDAQLRHMCVTWESEEGLTTFWVNGQRSIEKVVNRKGNVRGGGTIILGQEQDSVGGRFDANQCFVGEMADVNLWDHVLTANEINVVSQGCGCLGGNIIDWATIRYKSVGNVKIKDNKDCMD